MCFLKIGYTTKSFSMFTVYSLILCDTSDAFPIAEHPQSGSRINAYHALCTIELARRVLNTLPSLSKEKQVQSGDFRIGIISPYKKQVSLLGRLVKDAGLEQIVRVGTVHRFQGLEAEVIIFDTVESRYLEPARDFIMGGRVTNAMRLVNVAVTRAKHKLIIVANKKYISQKFDENDTLRLAVEEAQQAGYICSIDVLSIPASTQGKIQSGIEGTRQQDEQRLLRVYNQVLEQHTSKPKSDNYKPDFFNDKTFFPQLFQDMQLAKKQVIICSPFLGNRVHMVAPKLAEMHKSGVRVTVVTSISEGDKQDKQPLINILRDAGVELRTRGRMHEKLIFVDDDVVYEGSLNTLSHADTTEFMLRVQSPQFAMQLKQFMDVDAVKKKPVHTGMDIEIAVRELPAGGTCKKCGGQLVPKPSSIEPGAFYGCMNYSRNGNGCSGTENVSADHMNSVQSLKDKLCGRCGGQTKIDVDNRTIQLTCNAATPCGYGQKILFVR